MLVALVALIPLVFVVAYTVAVGWDQAYRLLVRPRVGELLANTVRLILAAVPLCASIGTGAAWLVERTTLPGRRVWTRCWPRRWPCPAFVNSFGWVSLTSRVEGYAGAVLDRHALVLPLVYLPVAAALRGPRPGAGGDGPRPRPRALADVRPRS